MSNLYHIHIFYSNNFKLSSEGEVKNFIYYNYLIYFHKYIIYNSIVWRNLFSITGGTCLKTDMHTVKCLNSKLCYPLSFIFHRTYLVIFVYNIIWYCRNGIQVKTNRAYNIMRKEYRVLNFARMHKQSASAHLRKLSGIKQIDVYVQEQVHMFQQNVFSNVSSSLCNISFTHMTD